MTMLKFTLSVVLLMFVACSSVVIDNHVDGKAVVANSGILVVGLHSDWEDYKGPTAYQLALAFIGEGDSSYAGRELVFQGANYYSVIQLPANTYHFEGQRLGLSFWGVEENNHFVIKPGTITYVGDITSNLSGDAVFKVEDKFSAAKEYLRKKYSRLLEKHALEKKLLTLKLQTR